MMLLFSIDLTSDMISVLPFDNLFVSLIISFGDAPSQVLSSGPDFASISPDRSTFHLIHLAI